MFVCLNVAADRRRRGSSVADISDRLQSVTNRSRTDRLRLRTQLEVSMHHRHLVLLLLGPKVDAHLSVPRRANGCNCNCNLAICIAPRTEDRGRIANKTIISLFPGVHKKTGTGTFSVDDER